MNYRNKNTINAILAFIGFTIAFYFFFYTFKYKILLAGGLGAFLTISMFFNPNKLEKLKKEEKKQANECALQKEISSKEISDEEVDKLDLDNIEGFDK